MGESQSSRRTRILYRRKGNPVCNFANKIRVLLEPSRALRSCYCNLLYTFPFPNPELRTLVRDHIHTLLRQVLQSYETNENHEQLFTGVQVMPTFAPWDDEELKRLRHLAYRYEYRRVTRNRRILYVYLLVQFVLVVLIFPNLMINAENGALQAQEEQLADVEKALSITRGGTVKRRGAPLPSPHVPGQVWATVRLLPFSGISIR